MGFCRADTKPGEMLQRSNQLLNVVVRVWFYVIRIFAGEFNRSAGLTHLFLKLMLFLQV